MWMQILQAGGIKTLGTAFGKTWKKTIKDANKRGFYESPLRRGIYYATNPNPVTGAWLHPKSSRQVGVKVFIPGTIRSDVLYLSRVIATVRPYRQYAKSLHRLYSMEANSLKKRREEKGESPPPEPVYLDPILEWWLENFLLVRDVVTRQYPARFVAYESVLQNPNAVLREVFDWLGTGDPEAAAEAIHPEDRTQKGEDVSDIEHPHAEVFDAYYRRVLEGGKFDEKFIIRMNETHEALLPQITKGLENLSRAQLERRKVKRLQARERREKNDEEKGPRAKRPAKILQVDRLDHLLHPLGPSGGQFSTDEFEEI